MYQAQTQGSHGSSETAVTSDLNRPAHRILYTGGNLPVYFSEEATREKERKVGRLCSPHSPARVSPSRDGTVHA